MIHHLYPKSISISLSQISFITHPKSRIGHGYSLSFVELTCVCMLCMLWSIRLLGFVIVCCDKGHFGDLGLLHLVADLEHDFRSGLGGGGGDVSHGDGLFEGGRKGTTRDFTNFGFARGIVNFRVVPGRSPHTGNAHTLAGHLLELAVGRQNLVSTQKSLLRTTASSLSTHGPTQHSLNGRRGLIQIIAIQTQTRLQTKRITSSQSRRHDRRIFEQFGRHRHCIRHRHGNLKPILSRISTPGDATSFNAVKSNVDARHEAHFGQVKVGGQ
mmetsp:Transcript_11565/g.21065  ORF Transcript_11565/g.21065 Transcript_11565/m.21065 type:complete len:270 (+) Transcript_11565:50-859(+)